MCFGFLFNSERLQFNSERNERHSERIVLKLAFFAILKFRTDLYESVLFFALYKENAII